MLGKVLKNEWKSTWKIPTAICVYLLILTLIGCISFVSPIWNIHSDAIELLAVFSLLVYILSLVIACVAVFAYFVVRFYRNMYSDEGYLTHTLPVNSHCHISAKGIVFFVWTTVSGIVVILSVAALIGTAMVATGTLDGTNWNDFWFEFNSYILPSLKKTYNEYFTIPLPVFILYGILCYILQSAASILMIYASISIGQTFNKYKVMASIIAYLALSTLLQIGASFISLPMIFNMERNQVTPQLMLILLLTYSALFSLITGVIYYVITHLAMAKHLNLD